MDGKGPWLIFGGGALLAAAIVAGALVVTSGDRDPVSPARAAGAPTPAGPTTDAPASTAWPPPLPPGVPTTGEHAWRVTWAPDADAEQQYRTELASSLDADFYAPNRDRLVSFGYEICADYYRGVSGEDEYNNIIGVLVADPDYQPAVSDRQVRQGAAALDAVTIEMAANHHFCMNIDPWGVSY